MQEMIESGLLIVVAVLSIILLLIGQRPSSGMTKKQKIMLGRILTATVLLLALQTLGFTVFDQLGASGRWLPPLVLWLWLSTKTVIIWSPLQLCCSIR